MSCEKKWSVIKKMYANYINLLKVMLSGEKLGSAFIKRSIDAHSFEFDNAA